MNKVGFSTGKGFHDDVERVRNDLERVRNDLEFLCVDYELTDLKLRKPVELELPEGRTIDDIIGIEFLGKSNWLTCFGRGREVGSVGTRESHCFGFVSGGTGGLHVEYVYVNIAPSGEKFSFEITCIGQCYTSGLNSVRNDTEGAYVFDESGVTKTIHIHFK